MIESHEIEGCPSCGRVLDATEAFCPGCGSSRSKSKPKPRRTYLLLGVAVVVCVILVGAFLLTSPKKKTASPEPTLAQRTTSLARQLRGVLCPSGDCIDSESGVIRLDSKPSGEYSPVEFYPSDLDRAARQVKIWTLADSARMAETRALDGTQRSSSGAVSWSYHPDSGIDLVVDVSSLP